MDPGWKNRSKQSTCCCDVFLSRLVHGQEGSGAAQRKALAVGRPRSLCHCRQHGRTWVFQKLHDMEIQNGIKMASWERIFHHGWGGASVLLFFLFFFSVFFLQWIGKIFSPVKLPNLQENRHWKGRHPVSSSLVESWVTRCAVLARCLFDFPLFAFLHWQRWRWWEATSFRLCFWP